MLQLRGKMLSAFKLGGLITAFVILAASCYITRLPIAVGIISHIGIFILLALTILLSFLLAITILKNDSLQTRTLFACCLCILAFEVCSYYFLNNTTDIILRIIISSLEMELYILLDCIILKKHNRKRMLFSLLLNIVLLIAFRIVFIAVNGRRIELASFYSPQSMEYKRSSSLLLNDANLMISILSIFNYTVLSIMLRTDVILSAKQIISHVFLTIGIVSGWIAFVLLFLNLFNIEHNEIKIEGRVDIASNELYYAEIGKEYRMDKGGLQSYPIGAYQCDLYMSDFDRWNNNSFFQFDSVSGFREVSDISSKKYLSNLADEVILIRNGSAWDVYHPRRNKYDCDNELLRCAIWDGIQNGQLILFIDWIDYLHEYDMDKTLFTLDRWSHGIFSFDELVQEERFNLRKIEEWASEELKRY